MESGLREGVDPFANLDLDPLKGKLLVIDASSGEAHVLLNELPNSSFLSPDGRYLAVFVVAPQQLVNPNLVVHPPDLEFYDHPQMRLIVLDLNGKKVMEGESLPMRLGNQAVWSRDSSKVAFTASSKTVGEANDRLYVEDVVTHQASSITESAQSIGELDWSSINLLVRTTDSRWHVVTEKGALLEVTGSHESISNLVSIGGDSIVGVGGGRLWLIDSQKATAAEMHSGTIQDISDTIKVTPCSEASSPYCMFVKSGIPGKANESGWFRLDPKSGKSEPIRLPTEGADLTSVSRNLHSGVFSKRNARGVFSIWATSDWEKPSIPIFSEENKYLNSIQLGEVRILRYRDLNGVEEGMRITLPPDYKKGRRYPVVAFVYTVTIPPPKNGLEVEPKNREEVEKDSLGRDDIVEFNLQVLAAKGYVVLEPSIPAGKNGTGSLPNDELYEHVLNGVIPAVDKLFDLGIADPDRLGVWGQSHGGEVVNDLLSQTKRFKAALSSSGLSDLISAYGDIHSTRFMSYPPNDLGEAIYMETTEGGMLGPPWEHPERYIRNSPLTYIDRIETPLMLVAGDLDDIVAVEQSEEMFAAMSRLNKRCRLVRYSGAGHWVSAPADIRDFWQRVFEWFDEYLAGSR
jgi:dipeptidyl aminopeptidase/acylaminoacyl peptidase